MPIAKVQLPDGKIARFDVPEGTTPEQVMDFAKQMPPQNSVGGGPELMKAHESLGDRQNGWQGTVSRLARPALEGGGAALGAIFGGASGLATGPAAPATVPAGAIAGGGLGYAAGSRGADLLDETLGLKGRETLPQAALETVNDIATGAAFEMGGPVVMTAGKGIYRGGKALASPITKLLSTEAGEAAAGKILQAHTSSGPIYAQNAAEAARIEREIPGLKFTLGQRTNNAGTLRLERTQIRRPGEGADLNSEQVANNTEALRAYYVRHFGGEEGIDDLIGNLNRQQVAGQAAATETREGVNRLAQNLPAQHPQQTGTDIVDAINTAKEPVQKAMGTLGNNIADYPMSLTSTERAIDDLLARKDLSMGQRTAVMKFKNDLPTLLKVGRTTHTATGVQRTLNERISKMFGQGDDAAAEKLLTIKSALQDDLTAVGAQARTGKLGEYQGKAVYPDELAAELEKNLQRQAVLEAESVPDIPKMLQEIKASGAQAMRVPGESDAAFTQRIVGMYQSRTGKAAPTTSKGNAPQELAALANRNQQITKILQNVQPGQDVAASMNAYNEFASTQYFSRFDRGAIAQATARGNQAGGTRLRAENIPALFTTPSGVKDLVKGVGKEQAATLMRGHASYDLLHNTTDPATGQIVTGKLNAWLKRNAPMLETLGIKGDFEGVAAAQAVADAAGKQAAAFEKTAAARMLKADPERAVAAALAGNSPGKAAEEIMDLVRADPAARRGLQNAFAQNMTTEAQALVKTLANDPTLSTAKFTRLMQKNAAAMRVIYRGEPEKIRALVTMQKALEVASRNTRSPVGGGSDSFELIFGELGKQTLIGRMPATVKTAVAIINKFGDDKINTLVTRALFDPDYAQTLIKAANGKIKPDLIESAIGGKIIKLADYRAARRTAAAAGMAGTITGAYNGGAD